MQVGPPFCTPTGQWPSGYTQGLSRRVIPEKQLGQSSSHLLCRHYPQSAGNTGESSACEWWQIAPRETKSEPSTPPPLGLPPVQGEKSADTVPGFPPVLKLLQTLHSRKLNFINITFPNVYFSSGI